MKTKLQIKNIFGIVLFEYESEDNTTKKTLEEAVRQGVDLSYAFLAYVDLSYANLKDAKLNNAILIRAKLNGAILTRAFLKNADLSEANLAFAVLNEAYLFEANLKYAVFTNSCLTDTNLSGANLTSAILRSTNLKEAILEDVILKHAMLPNTEYLPFISLNLPEGEFIGYKKLWHHQAYYIIKLKILADSKRSRAISDKCRCDKAFVLEIQNLDGSKSDLKEITNYNFTPCTYKVGEIVEADSWDENRFNECSHGIHFFLDRQRAVNY